ncbi:hypothetical protein E2C01_034247 [Portunus trituberculatus]|uniref:Uncharacterized protein n=1 Tax=Portunus trituberculatus TaxID=210409 RepID=A0A5B7F2C5_PORTR|nr:hypothetical protein [Portunus trituberculatus]
MLTISLRIPITRKNVQSLDHVECVPEYPLREATFIYKSIKASTRAIYSPRGPAPARLTKTSHAALYTDKYRYSLSLSQTSS